MLLVGLGGALLELWRFGATEASASARVERRVHGDFDRMTRVLGRVAAGIASDPAASRGLGAGVDAARDLFDLVDRRLADAGGAGGDLAATIYDTRGIARAWGGRPSDIRVPDRIAGPASFFVTPSPLGLRLVHVLPIVDAQRHRAGAVAVERVLSPASAAATFAASEFVLETPLGPASLRMRWEGAGGEPRPNAFLLRSPGGDPLVEVSMAPDDIARARARLRRQTAASAIAALSVALLLLIGPALDRRAEADRRAAFVGATAASLALLVAGTLLLWVALRLGAGQPPGAHMVLLLAGVAAAAAVALMAAPVARLRVAAHGARLAARDRLTPFLATQLLAGAAVAGLFVAFDRLLIGAIDPAAVDLRHFSLHPWVPARLALFTGMLASHIAALWAGTLILTAAMARWRFGPPASSGLRLGLALVWLAPSLLLTAAAQARGWPLPPWAVLGSAAVCAAATLGARRIVAWFRHATVAARILGLFSAFLVPALLLYPSVDFYADRAMRSLIATRYAVEAQRQQQTLEDHLSEARREIDRIDVLPVLVGGGGDGTGAAARPDSAFFVWKRTALARARLTSAIELYDRSGALVSRFALNYPEYSVARQAPQAASGCDWDVFGEATPFGSDERRVLHADRQICVSPSPGAPRQPVGTIVVHVLLFDYRTLPFISSQNPYFEVFRPAEGGAPQEGTTGSDVDVAIYGWSLSPIYTSGRVAWPITDALFARIYDPERRPFWAEIRAEGRRYHVHFSNDRVFIYAIGYPALTTFDHFVHLAELTTLSGILYVLVLLGTAFFSRIARVRLRIGRALLREVRASFYRKLFLAFVFASIVPVLILAFLIRTYFANLLAADVSLEAARTAAVAQRVIEQSNALLQRTDGLEPASDDVLMWISQVIDQDVNIFAGPDLLATSERDLFASGLLGTRTPGAVYRAIALQRLPSFVGEDRIGTFPYTIAAAPVRAGGRSAILTVPLANRQRDIDRQIDDLDRGVHLLALVFVLVGAAMGLYMAERIADPVRRLTRATRRIARGDFDAQVAVKTADELRRLVDAFNSMAAELKAQRTQLERTHRLEAWAEMARQVAHEIKNPLTPIQLSAEHLRRVHADRGEPMGEVLESCVTSILGQVRLLRQISAEFSNFASSPTARRAPVDLAELVADVIDPYRTGLAGRIVLVNGVAPPLPPVLVDRSLVARSLANIVENALHAMPGEGTLTLEAAVEPGFVVVAVRDTGPGMDEDALARVFEPYFSTKTTGTGLGLPIARRNIELNGGAVEVESVRGRGTTVRVRLPVAK